MGWRDHLTTTRGSFGEILFLTFWGRQVLQWEREEGEGVWGKTGHESVVLMEENLQKVGKKAMLHPSNCCQLLITYYMLGPLPHHY